MERRFIGVRFHCICTKTTVERGILWDVLFAFSGCLIGRNDVTFIVTKMKAEGN